MRAVLRSISLVVLLTLSLIGPALGAADACPGCAEALPGHVSHGFNMSVLFLMAMPFLVAGSLALGIIFISKNNKHTNLDAGFETESIKVREERES